MWGQCVKHELYIGGSLDEYFKGVNFFLFYFYKSKQQYPEEQYLCIKLSVYVHWWHKLFRYSDNLLNINLQFYVRWSSSLFKKYMRSFHWSGLQLKPKSNHQISWWWMNRFHTSSSLQFKKWAAGSSFYFFSSSSYLGGVRLL